MIFVLLLLPIGLYQTMKVALVDPHAPEKPSFLGVWTSVILGSIPVFLVWAPESAVYNASLALGISTVFTPLLFSPMKTDTAGEWILDKLFIMAVRTVFAMLTVLPLAYFQSYWFCVFGALAVALFYQRMFLWTLMGGDPRQYAMAVFWAFAVTMMYFLLVDDSKITPRTWTQWRSFLIQKENG